MIDTATDPWGIDIERVEVTFCSSCFYLASTTISPSPPAPPGEGRSAAPEPAESHGGGGWGHQGGQGQGGERLPLPDWPAYQGDRSRGGTEGFQSSQGGFWHHLSESCSSPAQVDSPLQLWRHLGLLLTLLSPDPLISQPDTHRLQALSNLAGAFEANMFFSSLVFYFQCLWSKFSENSQNDHWSCKSWLWTFVAFERIVVKKVNSVTEFERLFCILPAVAGTFAD